MPFPRKRGAALPAAVSFPLMARAARSTVFEVPNRVDGLERVGMPMPTATAQSTSLAKSWSTVVDHQRGTANLSLVNFVALKVRAQGNGAL